MEYLLGIIYAPVLTGIPVVVSFLAIAVGVALGRLWARTNMRRRQAKNMRMAQEENLIHPDGFVVNTYSKWGMFTKGYVLVDDDQVIFLNRNRKVLRKLTRSNIKSVTYMPSNAHNYAFVFDVKQGDPIRVYTFRPAEGNQYVSELINELQATRA